MMINSKIKVIIADDHDVYREGLKKIFLNNKEIKIIGEARNGRELIQLATELAPDVIVTDLIMPEVDGVKAIKSISMAKLPAKCIAISTFDSDQLIIEALEAGAMGYILKNADKEEIIEAIKTVSEQQPYYCKSTSLKLVKKILHSNFNPYIKEKLLVLSDTELQIIRLICQEKTSEEIGKILFMSKRNIEAFRVKILERTNSKTPIGLVIYAIKNGIFIIENKADTFPRSCNS